MITPIIPTIQLKSYPKRATTIDGCEHSTYCVFPFFIRLLTFSPVSLTYMTETELCSRSKVPKVNKSTE